MYYPETLGPPMGPYSRGLPPAALSGNAKSGVLPVLDRSTAAFWQIYFGSSLASWFDHIDPDFQGLYVYFVGGRVCGAFGVGTRDSVLVITQPPMGRNNKPITGRAGKIPTTFIEQWMGGSAPRNQPKWRFVESG
jgi:hypothetical protein